MINDETLDASYAEVYSDAGSTFGDDGTETDIIELRLTLDLSHWSEALADADAAAALLAWIEANR